MSNGGAKTEFEAQAESLIAAGRAVSEFLTDREHIARIIDHAAFEPGSWPSPTALRGDAKHRRELALDKADDILHAGFGTTPTARSLWEDGQ